MQQTFTLAVLLLTLCSMSFVSLAHGDTPADGQSNVLSKVTVEAPPENLPGWICGRAENLTLLTNFKERDAIALVRDFRIFARFVTASYSAAAALDRPLLVIVAERRNTGADTVWQAIAEGVAKDASHVTISLQCETPFEARDLLRMRWMDLAFEEKPGQYPLWFELGLKRVLAEIHINEQHLEVGRPPLFSPYSFFGMNERHMINYEDIFRATRQSAEYRDPNRRLALETQSLAFVHLSLFGAKKEYQARFAAFMNDSEMMIDPTASFERAFAMPVEDLNSQVRKFVQRNRYKYLTASFKISSEDNPAAFAPARTSDLGPRL